MTRFCWVALVCLGACSGSGKPPPTDPAALLTTLQDLAPIDQKRVGTANGRQAAEYVMMRMQHAGLTDVHMEGYQLPQHITDSVSIALTVNGAASTPAVDAFEGSGAGHADADVVYVGTAHPEDVAKVSLTGKIALLDRDQSYHRSAQYDNVSKAGATAMLYISAAAENLIQIGSVRIDGWQALGPIPAVTIGADDGQTLKDALAAGGTVHSVIDVQAHSEPSSGNNVIGRIPGSDPAGQIVIGAHFDTWFAGSCDNGGGVAALLALLERRLKQAQPRYTLIFVGYDGEEVALYGGYDYLRKHRIVTHDPILAVLNFEMPSATDSTLTGVGHSNHPVLDDALMNSDVSYLYPLYVPMDVVPMILGGLIPTDIQGIYRNGVPTATTASQSPWYHTIKDTPDKVNTDTLAQVVDAFDVAIDLLMKDEPSAFAGQDPKVWEATLTPQPRAAGAPLIVDVAITNSVAAAQAGANVDATLMVDDFFPTSSQHAMTGADGHVQFTFPASAVDTGTSNRFVHVTAGPQYPFVEQILPLD
jgi:Zn-dependent M28 family amino/carboxypeptidase